MNLSKQTTSKLGITFLEPAFCPTKPVKQSVYPLARPACIHHSQKASNETHVVVHSERMIPTTHHKSDTPPQMSGRLQYFCAERKQYHVTAPCKC
jgi:hypothetical protein